MKVKKLDNRFRIFKAGFATHYSDIDPKEYFGAGGTESLMTEAFGIGGNVPTWRKLDHTDRKYDWFYSCKDTWVEESTQISTSKTGHPVYSVRRFKNYVYRIYFRREDQATLLVLKASA
jgi:hypothetical protein